MPGVAGPLRVHLRLEFHDEGNDKTRLELRQGPFADGQLGARGAFACLPGNNC